MFLRRSYILLKLRNTCFSVEVQTSKHVFLILNLVIVAYLNKAETDKKLHDLLRGIFRCITPGNHLIQVFYYVFTTMQYVPYETQRESEIGGDTWLTVYEQPSWETKTGILFSGVIAFLHPAGQSRFRIRCLKGEYTEEV